MSWLAFKSLLNEYCQKRRVSLPNYSTKPVQTPQGTRHYSCKVKLFDGNTFESQGVFSNKKSAEQNAAEQALVALGQIADAGMQNTGSSITEPCCGAAESIATEETSSSNECTVINSNTVTIASTSGEISMSPVQTVGQAKQNIFLDLTTAKNLLNERAQKLHLALPSYQTEADSHGVGFISRVTFNSVTYCSNGAFRLKKEAEKSAALEALKVLLQQKGVEGHGNATSGVEVRGQEFRYLEENNKNVVTNVACNVQDNSGMVKPDNPEVPHMNIQGFSPDVSGSRSAGLYTSVQIASETASQSSSVSFKNLLQEYMQQRGIINGPKYETSMADFGLFKSTVYFCGKSIESTQGFSTKKQAEQMAARHALLDLGVEEPEKLSTSRKGKDRTSKLGSLKRKHFQGPGNLDFLWDTSPNLDPRHRKRRRLDENLFAPKSLKLQSPLVEKTVGHIDFLSVGELWKEKKNVAIIGNDKTSFVLHCTRVDGSLQILNSRIMENVELKQGYRIIGLDADFVQRQGHLILQSERCADIEIPETADPVLISCGAVVLHLDPNNSSNTEVLLKRYTHSQAFINVKAALAQFFRRSVSGHPLPLPVASLAEHIQQWALEEVGYVAAMDVPAMQQVFLNFWKFKDSWCSILEQALPNDLKDLQTRAQKELSRRISCGANTNDASSYPWGLPKGNFRHRMLSTGLHIEKPSECAARELREETGIQVDPSDLEKISYVDIPQDDNLNPHRGDMARYFLYLYNPIIEELNASTNDNVMPSTPLGKLVEPSLKDTLPLPSSLSSSSSPTSSLEISRKNLLPEDQPNLTAAQESKKESLNVLVVKDSCIPFCNSMSSPSSTMSTAAATLSSTTTTTAAATTLSSTTIAAATSSSTTTTTAAKTLSSTTIAAAATSSLTPKKKTPLNTDFEAEDYSSENSNLSLFSKSDPMYPTMPCKGNLTNIDSEMKNESNIQGKTKILESMEECDLGGNGKADHGQENILKNDNLSSDVQCSPEGCLYQVKQGQKRKRVSSEDEEFYGEDDIPNATQQEPGTSTPEADSDTSRYQSPTVQGAKHEECSWFPIDEALKISPTFATIYKTEKFTELLTLLKNTWT